MGTPTAPQALLPLPGCDMSDEDFANLSQLDISRLIFNQNRVINANVSSVYQVSCQSSQLLQILLQTQSQIAHTQQLQTQILDRLVTMTEGMQPDNLAKKMEERALRDEKKPNLVLYGLPEPDSDPKKCEEKDLQSVQRMMVEVDADSNSVVRVQRLGRPREAGKDPRPLKIFTNNFWEKRKLLNGQRYVFQTLPSLFGSTVSGKKPFLRHDLTPMQLEERRLLFEQLAKTKADDPAGANSYRINWAKMTIFKRSEN